MKPTDETPREVPAWAVALGFAPLIIGMIVAAVVTMQR